jgi:DNA-binding response OmpR family regulator
MSTETTQSTGGTSGSPKVLVVDDDKDLADTYAVWLSDRCEVETAYGGLQARKALDATIDIVLLDRRMPGVPGDRVLEDIHDQGIDCQVAMLTAVEPDTDIIDLSFDEYLVKPVTQSSLRETVDDLLLRAGFGEEAQEYFAMESKSEALESRDQENLRDPEAAAALRGDTEHARESERIQELKNQLERLRRITSVIRDIDEQLVVATSREEIERTTCERLVNAEPYELAWIGDYTVSFDQLTPRVSAGDDSVSLEGEVAADGGNGPVAEAVSSREVQVVDDLSPESAPGLLEPLGADGVDHFAAGAVVPLAYRDTVYGTLTVYTDEADVFDDREVSVLSDLGDSIANAINSVETKRLMLSDTVVELGFDVSDPTDVFVSLSAMTDSRIELKGFVPAAEGQLTSYLEVTGVSSEEFLDTAVGMDGVETVRGIGESDDVRLYECRVDGPTVVLSFIQAGANVESMEVGEGTGHLTVTVAPDTDIRTVVESVQQSIDVDLISKRETERDFQSTDDFRQSLENQLTDRQYSVLQAAYSAGYFDWPRGSTAKEIASSLDLAPPTLHEHLRGAQNALIETFFDETGEFDEDERLRPDED